MKEDIKSQCAPCTGTEAVDNARSSHSSSIVISRVKSKKRADNSYKEEEKRLAVSACAGDTDAFSQLTALYGRAIYNLSLRYLPRSEAEDIAQETFIRAFVHLSSFDPERPILPWLITIARRLCIDTLRKNKPDLDEDVENAQESGPDAECQVSTKQEFRLLKQGLDSLPEGPRETIFLYHFEGLSYTDIAHALQVPQGTVMTWLYRGRSRLREFMKKTGHLETTQNKRSRDREKSSDRIKKPGSRKPEKISPRKHTSGKSSNKSPEIEEMEEK